MMLDAEEIPRPTPPRILRKDGKWMVPEWERPANWRQLEQPIPYQERPRDVGVVQQRKQHGGGWR